MTGNDKNLLGLVWCLGDVTLASQCLRLAPSLWCHVYLRFVCEALHGFQFLRPPPNVQTSNCQTHVPTAKREMFLSCFFILVEGLTEDTNLYVLISVGLALAKASTMRISIPFDLSSWPFILMTKKFGDGECARGWELRSIKRIHSTQD